MFSAYSKLYPIEPFEFTFVDTGISGWRFSPFLARIVIGLEFFIGLLFVFQINIRSFTSKLSIGLLSFFTIYLTIILIKNGNEANCGCFGEMIPMTTVQSIIKNVIFLTVSIFLLKKGIEFNYNKKIQLLAKLITGLFALIFPYILNPVDLNYSESYLIDKGTYYRLPLDSLINSAKINKVDPEIKNQKMVIAFMSSTCPHCKIAATKLRIMKEKNPELPIYFVINGEEKNIRRFQELTQSADIPWTQLNGKNFVYLAGFKMPKIVLINKQEVELEPNYFTLDQTEIENWLKKPDHE